MYNESNDANANPFFINRILHCQSIKNKFPNFITIDFFELGNGINVVNQLNDISTNHNIEYMDNKELISIKNFLGKEVNIKMTHPLLYIYDDGTVEKRIVVE